MFSEKLRSFNIIMFIKSTKFTINKYPRNTRFPQTIIFTTIIANAIPSTPFSAIKIFKLGNFQQQIDI